MARNTGPSLLQLLGGILMVLAGPTAVHLALGLADGRSKGPAEAWALGPVVGLLIVATLAFLFGLMLYLTGRWTRREDPLRDRPNRRTRPRS